MVTNGDVAKAAAQAARAAERKREGEKREANKKAVKAAIAANPAASSPLIAADIATQRPRSRLGKGVMLKAGCTNGGSSGGRNGGGGSGSGGGGVGGGGHSSPCGVREKTEWGTGADAAHNALRMLDEPIPTPTQSVTTTTGNTNGTDIAEHQTPTSPPSRPPHLIRQQQSPPLPKQELTKSFPSEEVPSMASTSDGVFPADNRSYGFPPGKTAGGSAATGVVQPVPVVSPAWPSWAPLEGQDYSVDIDEFFSDDISTSALPFSPEMWTQETAAAAAAVPAPAGGRLGNDNLFAASAAAATVTTTTAPNVGPWYGQHTGGGYTGGAPAQPDSLSRTKSANNNIVANDAPDSASCHGRVSDMVADDDEEPGQDSVVIPAKSTPAGMVAEVNINRYSMSLNGDVPIHAMFAIYIYIYVQLSKIKFQNQYETRFQNQL